MRLFARLAVAFLLVSGLAGPLLAQPPTPESLIAAIRQRLGASPGPTTAAADQTRQIQEVLAAEGANPSAALARIREVVGSPTAPPAPEDEQELTFIGQMVAADGQDYYNLLFVRDIHWFQMGIVWDAAEFGRVVAPWCIGSRSFGAGAGEARGCGGLPESVLTSPPRFRYRVCIRSI